MYNKISEEDNIFMKIPGVSKIFKPEREPYKDLDKAFRDGERVLKDKNSSKSSLNSIKFSNVVSKLILWNYNSRLNRTAKEYMSEIESTGGVYGKRNPRIRQSVDMMNSLIKKNYKRDRRSPYTLFDVFLRAYNILNDRNWSKAYNSAYKFHKKGKESASLIYMEYQFLVYTVESLTLMMREYSNFISTDRIMEANELLCKRYASFTTSVCKNIVKIILKCEYSRSPSKYVNDIVKIEKRYEKGQESEFFKVEKPEPDSVSEESALGAAVIYGGLTIISAVTIIHALRYIIYSLSCLTVDISKSLIDQSYVLLVNIEKLEKELAETKEGSKEYKNLQKIIERQKFYTEKLTSIAKKLSDTDMESIDEIRSKEYNDNETIETTIDDDDDGNMDGGFDI